MVYGKSLHRAKEVKIQLLDCKGSGLFHSKEPGSQSGILWAGRGAFLGLWALSPPLLSCLWKNFSMWSPNQSPSFSRLCKQQKLLKTAVNHSLWEESSLNTVFTVCAACKLIQVFVLNHFCHEAENNIGNVCLKLSFCKFEVLQISVVVFENAFMA